MVESKDDFVEEEVLLTKPFRIAILHDDDVELAPAAKRGKFVRTSVEDKTVVDVSIFGRILKGKLEPT